MKYNVFQNIIYVYKAAFEHYPRIKKYLSVNLITEILKPLLPTVITTMVVFALTTNQNLSYYLLIIFLLVLVTLLVDSLQYWSFILYTFDNTYTRNTVFWLELTLQQLHTDYLNIEPQNKRKVITKAYESIGSNWRGLELMAKQAPIAIIGIIGMLVFGVLIALYVPLVLLVLIVMSIVNFFLTRYANIYMESKREDINQQFIQGYYLCEDCTNPTYGKDIRLYNLGDWFKKIFHNVTTKRTNLAKQVERRFSYVSISNQIFLFLRDFVSYILLIYLFVNDGITIVTFTFMIGIVTGFSLWLSKFIESSNHLRTANIAVNEYRACLTMENQFNHQKGVSIDSLILPPSIEFHNVTFTYPESTTPTINNLSFHIKAGEKVALVGDNGAGKTTIIKLLCGLYEADSGEIRINGYDIHKFNLEEYMTLFSVVFQDSEPLALTIENNVTCQPSNISNKEKLWEALSNAQLADKVSSLEKQEQTFMTQIFDLSGIRLSGGEVQRLMLARALYKNAPILILDEPTAALDPIAEEQMYLQYDELVSGNTSLFISHRLSSTKFCDRILFLQNGSIIEEGSHDYLMSINKHYKEVFDIQSKYYKEDVQDETY